MKRGVICILFCFLLVAGISVAWGGEEPSSNPTISPPGSYLDVRGLVELGVVGGFLQYNMEELDRISQNKDPLPMETEYVVWYYFDTDSHDCPLCQTELEKLIETFFYDSQLAKDGKVT